MTHKYAPAWKRIVAYLIDGAIVATISGNIYWVLKLPYGMQGWLTFALFMLYNIFMDYRFQGTAGKNLLKLKVIKTNGEQLDLKTAFYRNFGKIVSALPLYWGFIRLLTPSYPQGIHDELARCYVVER